MCTYLVACAAMQFVRTDSVFLPFHVPCTSLARGSATLIIIRIPLIAFGAQRNDGQCPCSLPPYGQIVNICMVVHVVAVRFLPRTTCHHHHSLSHVVLLECYRHGGRLSNLLHCIWGNERHRCPRTHTLQTKYFPFPFIRMDRAVDVF